MKKTDSFKAQLNQICSSWNFLISASWLIIYSMMFGTIYIVQYSVSVVELYIKKDHLIVILLSVMSVILIYDAVNHNQE